ncbi:TetR/AcrR family transcriptional regulator C-terminal domain-containing protein [Streptomyces sp. LS1784]|uniref:TetR/AcrR family transcriptional regulator C-terminal domain-containing protein n=1 Tax=Streptomyces sp. LS1784 TaxID=2851533 RepID=UPI001CCEF716|nr:TetR/AcrR family transcriptional regulator C-terminal domain-containing protein [Streptomyces sp. LS1784]
MTKKQTPAAPRTRLDPAAVVRAALELLDEKGADAVSLRGTAERLGVRMNTVLWHAKTKARLLELMAEAIVAEVPLTDLPAAPDERVRELARRYRRSLLAHRDGAAVVAGTYAAEPATLAFAEHVVAALLGAGLDERHSAWTFWSIQYLTLGLTQEQQALTASGEEHTLGPALAAGSYPALDRVVPHLEDTAFDERFEFGLDQLLRPLGPTGEA